MSKISKPASICLSLCGDCGGSHTGHNASVVECIQCGKGFRTSPETEVDRTRVRGVPASMLRSSFERVTQWSRAVTRRRSGSWFVSCVGSLSFNTSILLFLMYLWIGSRPPHSPALLQAGFLAAGPENAFEQLSDPNAGAAALSTITVTKLPQSLMKGRSESDGLSLLSGDGTGNGLSLKGTGVGGGGMFQGAPDAGSFAYVVDASGSMSGPRMRLVLNELVRSINALAEHQQFFVIFFSHRSFPMMWPASEIELIDANPANRKRIVDWALNVDPDGETKPQASLKTALRLCPDVLYFLTDGEIPRESIRIVERLRTKNTIVNTICVGDARSGQLMKQIARKGNGTYTLVR